MSIIESSNGVGARLAEARSEQGMSVEDLSSRTYIRPGVIRGIENDDFEPCGGPFYARGHIRTLARTLGVEQGPLLEQFDRRHGAPESRIAVETPVAEPSSRRSAKARERASSSGGPGWMAVATVVLVVICLVLLVSVLVGGPSKNDTTSLAQPSAAPKPSAAAPKGAAPAPSAAPARTYSGVNLALNLANGNSWVRVTDENGSVLTSATASQGATAEYRGAQQLKFTVGNAGAVNVSCNGKDLGPLGSTGQVVSRVLVVGDPACGASTG
ncbi:MAG: cytoskeleton protein RodZ [Frankiaceae bacterium]|jgi:cytoskeletal protein RodZ|nr:cytoskeleton protein RodZ [Frankiaceae bacterium]